MNCFNITLEMSQLFSQEQSLLKKEKNVQSTSADKSLSQLTCGPGVIEFFYGIEDMRILIVNESTRTDELSHPDTIPLKSKPYRIPF